MANSFNQLVGEKIRYQQSITGDVIASALWDAPDGFTISSQVDNATDTSVLLLAGPTGASKVTCAMTMTSGQIRITVAVVNVLDP